MIHTLHSRVWHRPVELLLERKTHIVLIQILVVSQSFVYVLWLKAGQQLDPLPQISLWRVKQKCLWAPTRQRERWHFPGKWSFLCHVETQLLASAWWWVQTLTNGLSLSLSYQSRCRRSPCQRQAEEMPRAPGAISSSGRPPLCLAHSRLKSGITFKHLLSNCALAGWSDLIVSFIWKCSHRVMSCHIKVKVKYQWLLN